MDSDPTPKADSASTRTPMPTPKPRKFSLIEEASVFDNCWEIKEILCRLESCFWEDGNLAAEDVELLRIYLGNLSQVLKIPEGRILDVFEKRELASWRVIGAYLLDAAESAE